VVTFKPGKEMEERVRQLEEKAAAEARARANASVAPPAAVESDPQSGRHGGTPDVSTRYEGNPGSGP
jgi:hypothetical protein